MGLLAGGARRRAAAAAAAAAAVARAARNTASTRNWADAGLGDGARYAESAPSMYYGGLDEVSEDLRGPADEWEDPLRTHFEDPVRGR